METDATGTGAAGYARVRSTARLGGTLIFNQRSDNQIDSEAGVSASPVGQKFSIPVIFVAGVSSTGIALVNPSSSPVEATLTLKDTDGSVLEQTTRNLNPGNHSADFASNIFPSIQEEEEFRGSIEISAPGPIAAIALKQQGSLLTTFPVVIL